MSSSLDRRHASAFRTLVALFHHRWAVPVLALLLQDRGAKFVTLTNRLGAGTDVLRQTLSALVEQGLVRKNPGYGHPMRPEYLLTPRGARLAPWAQRVLRVLRSLGAEGVGLRKWSMAVALALASGERRFGELKEALPGVTARALTLALGALEDAGVVERRVVGERRPVPLYRLTRRGRRLAPVVSSLAAG